MAEATTGEKAAKATGRPKRRIRGRAAAKE